MTYFILECALTGETDEVYCCPEHAEAMPPVGDLVRALPADEDCDCDFCPPADA